MSERIFLAKIEGENSAFDFFIESESVPIISISRNGNVYVRGELVDENTKIYEAFKEWLFKAKIIDNDEYKMTSYLKSDLSKK